ncbi:MAG: FHA domain-containing protein [Sandaracinus sp.]|nr:FHA domain-containing protein [Myxococcales bacterium]MCB9615840.1 FHA domain-containing protein [Sandaracinus sp.]MCB9635977.1 FHA domain-containing protein [Sandaracinus sp.]
MPNLATTSLVDEQLPLLLVRHRDGGSPRGIGIDKLPFLVGSATHVDLRLPAPTVSRRHVLFEWHEDGVLVRDQGSRNGTHVNDERVIARPLREGDVVKVGPYTLELRFVNLED